MSTHSRALESGRAGHFVEIETDEGVTGLGGPISREQADVINRDLKPLLIGEDPRATERLGDKMYRFMVHGRQGTVMMAISVIDCALGFSIEPERVRERATWIVGQGFRATKWFFRHGPTDGAAELS